MGLSDIFGTRDDQIHACASAQEAGGQMERTLMLQQAMRGVLETVVSRKTLKLLTNA